MNCTFCYKELDSKESWHIYGCPYCGAMPSTYSSPILDRKTRPVLLATIEEDGKELL